MYYNNYTTNNYPNCQLNWLFYRQFFSWKQTFEILSTLCSFLWLTSDSPAVNPTHLALQAGLNKQQFANSLSAWNRWVFLFFFHLLRLKKKACVHVCVCARTSVYMHANMCLHYRFCAAEWLYMCIYACIVCVSTSASVRVPSVCSYSMCVCQHHRSISHGVSWKLTTG